LPTLYVLTSSALGGVFPYLDFSPKAK